MIEGRTFRFAGMAAVLVGLTALLAPAREAAAAKPKGRVPSADAHARRTTPPDPSAELARKGTENLGTHTPSPTATISYNGTNVGGPEWNRPVGIGPSISGLGPVRYQAQQFRVDLTGAYDLTSTQSFDGYLHLYQNAFNPADGSQTVNILAANDDGSGGIGTSEILGFNLTAGTTYILVTSGFSAGDEGTFTNTITGPGNITLVGLSISKSVNDTAPDIGENVVFTIGIQNEGFGDIPNVTVTDPLAAALTYVSDTCGGSFAGGTWTWNVGTFVNNTTRSCTLTARYTTCAVVANTATLNSTVGSPSATVTITGANGVADGSFEAGSPSPSWAEASTNYGTPLCDSAGCGTGGGTAGPRTGDWWAWFGGAGSTSTLPEVGSLQQSFTVPSGAVAQLQFYLWIGTASGNGQDFLRALVDGTQVFNALENAPGYSSYALVSVSLAAYADGLPHVLRIEGTQFGATTTNFNVDDVAVVYCAQSAADVSITKTISVTTIPAGQLLTFPLTVSNAGPGAAAGVVVTDALPAGMTYVSNTCGATVAAGTLTWNVGNLAAGANAACNVTVQMGVAPLGAISNTATVTSATADPTPANNTSTARVTLISAYVQVPTLSEVGLAALALALAAAGFLFLRRQA